MNQRSRWRVGSRVCWMWLGRPVHGTVKDVFIERVEKVIKGKTIVRNGSKDRPAYLVVSDAGNEALKLHSELRESKISPGTKTQAETKSRPQMYHD